MTSLSPLQWIQAALLGVLLVGFITISVVDHYETRRRIQRRRKKWALSPSGPPGVSVVVVAHNQEAGLIDTVSACLDLDYPRFEVIVVNDGSVDGTLDTLDDVFGLTGTPSIDRESVATKPVRSVYRAKSVWGLRVVDKHYGGPTDALAAGINEARHDIVCEVQVDSPPDADALRRLVAGDCAPDVRLTHPRPRQTALIA